MKTTLTLGFFSVALALAGCGKKDDHGHDHAGHQPTHHEHVAMHGGTLVEVGEHQFNLEFLHDPAAGKLTMWVLDAHGENFVRVRTPAIQLITSDGGVEQTLTLSAVANAATSETVGDTSQFEGSAPWLKDVKTVPVRVPSIEIRGQSFRDIKVTIGVPTQERDHGHDAHGK